MAQVEEHRSPDAFGQNLFKCEGSLLEINFVNERGRGYMPIFRLDAKAGTEGDPRWHVPKGGPTTFWVHAENEDSARQKIDYVTCAMAEFVGDKIEPSPWVDRKLSTCVENSEIAPPEGVAIDASGHTYTIA